MSRTTPTDSTFRALLWLAAPVFAENALHALVGVTDTYLANNLVGAHVASDAALAAAHQTNAAAGAAVGSVSYLIWFVGLIVSAVGTGSTALIARAVGARHRRLATKVCGQSIAAAIGLGVVVAVLMFVFAGPLTTVLGLPADAAVLFRQYLRILVAGVPFAVLMFTANSCLRGSGDTLAPAAAMIVVDVVNMFFSYGLTYGRFGLPELGFRGIAIGTSLAYVSGGLLQLAVLLSGRRRLRLFPHRLRPEWHTMRRVLRVGLPAGGESLLWWVANFAVIATVNRLGDAAAAAHSLAVRVESFSFMGGLAVATGVSALVGQRLGAGSPAGARRVALTGYAFGGGLMGLMGVAFVVFSHWWAGLFTADPAVRTLTADCLFVTGFGQCGMAASIVFGAALRGAGDTLAAMLASLGSVVLVRCGGVSVAAYFHASLPVIWVVLTGEQLCRGLLVFGWFTTGRWQSAKV